MGFAKSSRTSWPCVALERANLADRTTLGVGGDVEWLLEPADPAEMQAAWVACIERGGRPRVLGGGANLVIDDGLLPGAVIATRRMGRIFRPRGPDEASVLDAAELPSDRIAAVDPAADPRLVAWAGASLPGLVRAARDLGYAGLEGLVGVPGHVGGATAMNAGGRWGDFWDVVESVRVLEPDGHVRDLARADVTPSYRDGGLDDRTVLGSVLRLRPEPRSDIRERMRTYLLEKKRVQPVTESSAGCIFKNPDPEVSSGRSAGRLIEECGGKGLTRGAAAVSPLHGNFIINGGGATATDVFLLMDALRDLVAERPGIVLEFEVRRWRRASA